VAAHAENNLVTADFNANNQQALDALVNEHGVNLQQFPDDVIEALARTSAEVVAEIAGRRRALRPGGRVDGPVPPQRHPLDGDRRNVVRRDAAEGHRVPRLIGAR
jgi:hypothetical protein